MVAAKQEHTHARYQINRVTLEKLNIKTKKGNKNIKVRQESEGEHLKNTERKNKQLQVCLSLQPTTIRQNSRERDPANQHNFHGNPALVMPMYLPDTDSASHAFQQPKESQQTLPSHADS